MRSNMVNIFKKSSKKILKLQKTLKKHLNAFGQLAIAILRETGINMLATLLLSTPLNKTSHVILILRKMFTEKFEKSPAVA